MGRGLAVIVNGNANRGRFVRPGARHGVAQLRAQLRRGERIFVTHSLAELDAVARGLAADPPETLGIVGGDGSISASLSALHRHDDGRPLPQLLLLRGGTMNTVAKGLGLRSGHPLSRLAAFRRAPEAADVVYTLKADGHLGFLFSAGLMQAFVAEYDRKPFGTGPAGAAGLLAAGVGSALVGGALAARLSEPLCARLQIDGRAEPVARYLFVGAGTVPEVGIGFRPYARVGLSCGGRPAGFHLLGYHGPVRSLVPSLPRFARGQGARVPEALDRLCREATIEPVAGPVRFALDGDVHETMGPLQLRLGPTVRVVG